MTPHERYLYLHSQELVYPELENDNGRLMILIEMLEEFPAMRHRLIEWMKLYYPKEMEE